MSLESYIKERRAKGRVNTANYVNRLREEAIDILGGRCASPNCKWVNEDGSRGCTDRRCLQIDHKKGGGTKHTKSVSAAVRYREIIRNLDRDEWFQLLCANCNWIKKVENDETARAGREYPDMPITPAADLPVPTEPIYYWIGGVRVARDRETGGDEWLPEDFDK